MMAAGRRNVKQQQQLPRLDFDTCDFFSPTPAFADHLRVLLRRVFFIDEDRTKYVSVGFYPARDYQPLVEFGFVKKNKTTVLVLADQQVAALAAILPGVCESMCANEPYVHKDGDFKVTARGIARMYLHNRYINLTQNEIRHLSRIFHIVQKQLDVYVNAMADVLTYATAALSSTAYVEPSPCASRLVAYPQLYEELKTIL